MLHQKQPLAKLRPAQPTRVRVEAADRALHDVGCAAPPHHAQLHRWEDGRAGKVGGRRGRAGWEAGQGRWEGGRAGGRCPQVGMAC